MGFSGHKNKKAEQLKKDIFDKVNSDTLQKMIEELRDEIRDIASYNIFIQHKASLIGNAESAARVVDLQVQNLTRKNKPIPAELQTQHANARTNLHLVKDFLYKLEDLFRTKRRY